MGYLVLELNTFGVDEMKCKTPEKCQSQTPSPTSCTKERNPV